MRRTKRAIGVVSLAKNNNIFIIEAKCPGAERFMGYYTRASLHEAKQFWNELHNLALDKLVFIIFLNLFVLRGNHLLKHIMNSSLLH